MTKGVCIIFLICALNHKFVGIHEAFLANIQNLYSEQKLENEACHVKTNVLVSDQVRHKPGCTATEDG